MRVAVRCSLFAVVALALVAGATTISAARPPSGGAIASSDDALAFPARPAGARELPASRVRPSADVDWGIANPAAVAAFRASRMFGAMRSFGRSFGRANFVEHAGQGYYLIGSGTGTFGAYANHVVYPKQREPGNPNAGAGFLYAPTFFGPGNDCIEAVTVVENSLPQIWAWDWCAANPNPYAIVNVTKKFHRLYIRKMPDGLPEYSVETILASDGVTWDMALYNYTRKRWDIIYQTSGARNPNYGLGQQGWNFFETYTNVNGNVSDVCNPFPGPLAADNISISFDDQTFSKITASDSTPLQFANFYCTHFTFSTPQSYEWMMRYV